MRHRTSGPNYTYDRAGRLTAAKVFNTTPAPGAATATIGYSFTGPGCFTQRSPARWIWSIRAPRAAADYASNEPAASSRSTALATVRSITAAADSIALMSPTPSPAHTGRTE